MKPKILFVGLNPPATDRGGDAGVRFSLIQQFVKAGYDVAYLYLDPTRNPTEIHDMARRRLHSFGVSQVEYVKHRRDLYGPRQLSGLFGIIRKIHSRLFFSEAYYSPWREMAPEVSKKVASISPDCCFLYMLETCAALIDVKDIPKVLGIGVFPHKNREAQIRLLYRESIWKWLFEKIDYLIQRPKRLRETRESLASVNGVCAFAKNAETICRQLLPNQKVEYLTNPIPDARTTFATSPSLPADRTPPFRISLVGHLRATATLRGLDFFAYKIIPALKRKGVFDQFQFEVIGKFSPPQWLEEKLDYPNISYLGFVEDLQSALESADVFLVPTADDLGNRSRIVSAWSIGCCVVCHANSILGMPELESGKNCLIGGDETEIVEALLAAVNDRNLNHRLRENGQADYAHLYAPDISFPPILRFMKDVMRDVPART